MSPWLLAAIRAALRLSEGGERRPFPTPPPPGPSWLARVRAWLRGEKTPPA